MAEGAEEILKETKHFSSGRHSRHDMVLNVQNLFPLFILGIVTVGFAGCSTEDHSDQFHTAIDANDLKVLPDAERKAAESLEELQAIISIEKGHVSMVRSNDGSFDDKGMAYLQSLPELQILILTGEGITDKGLKNLKDLKNLAQVQLTGTRISGRAIENLRRHLGRRCKIVVSKF